MEKKTFAQSRLEGQKHAVEIVGKGNGLFRSVARRVLSELYARDSTERSILSASGRDVGELLDANRVLKRR